MGQDYSVSDSNNLITIHSLEPNISYQTNEQANYCQTTNCYEKTNANYCSFHQEICQVAGCNQRISVFKAGWNKYCERHDKKCQNCSNRIAVNQRICSNCTQKIETEIKEALKEQQLKDLVKANTTITGEIKEVERFSPWFNPNCATVIAENNNYALYLVVYEPAKEKMEKIIAPIKIEGNYTSFSSAQGKATNLRANLQNSANPILEVFPNPNSSTSFNSLVSWPYVVKRDLPYEPIGTRYQFTVNYSINPEDYIKPLDIVWVEKTRVFDPSMLSDGGFQYFHVCVYLGNNKVCHISGDNQGAKIESWRDFIQDPIVSLSEGELIDFIR